MLQVKPVLALERGTVTDLAKREFKNITGFQYAVWALDWHMWRMLLKYMVKEAAALQFGELEEKGTAHGKHFSLTPLIEALAGYAQNCNAWYRAEKWEEMRVYWCKEVGGKQWLLPAHVVNEYCHPTRPFYPCPEFREDNLIRSMEFRQGQVDRFGTGALVSGTKKHWFMGGYNEEKLREAFAIARYRWTEARVDPGLAERTLAYYVDVRSQWVSADTEALLRLSKVRQKQLEELRAELQYFLGVKELLNNHFPSALSSAVLGYLS